MFQWKGPISIEPKLNSLLTRWTEYKPNVSRLTLTAICVRWENDKLILARWQSIDNLSWGNPKIRIFIWNINHKMLLFFGGQLENWVEEIGSVDLNQPREKITSPIIRTLIVRSLIIRAWDWKHPNIFQLFELNPF